MTTGTLHSPSSYSSKLPACCNLALPGGEFYVVFAGTRGDEIVDAVRAVDIVSTGIRGESLDEFRAHVRVAFLVEGSEVG